MYSRRRPTCSPSRRLSEKGSDGRRIGAAPEGSDRRVGWHWRVVMNNPGSSMKLPAAAYSAETVASAAKAGSYGVFGEG